MELTRQSISLKKLHLDTENARHGDISNEDDAVRWMLTDYRSKEKIYRLAKDISEKGLSPIDDILVVPMDDTSDEYVVVEGNRRITAVKLLANPDLASTEVLKRRYRELAKKMIVDVPKSIECKVAPGFQEAAYWVQLRHGGEQEGVGTVSWGSKELERFKIRTGRRGQNAKSMDVLDYAHEKNLLSVDQIRNFPLTNLTRLLNDPGVRVRLGLELTADGVTSTLQEPAFHKVLGVLLGELADGLTTVTRIKQKDQRREYVDEVLKKSGIDEKMKSNQPYLLKGKGPSGLVVANFQKSSRRAQHQIHERKTVIPKNFRISFTLKRLNTIFLELQNIRVEDYPNAAAVLLRVFFEGCLDRYAEKEKLTGYNRNSENLKKRAQTIIDHLKKSNRIDKSVANPVVTFLTSPHSIGSITTFNSYIHNIKHQPIPRDLKTAWDNLTPFFESMDGHL